MLRQSESAAGKEQPGLMAMSTMPLRSRDEDGKLRLVNLEPERVGDAFGPDNARIKLSIGDHAADGVKILNRDISIVPLDVKAVAGVKAADAVMFANSAEDSDHIVRVTPAGADSLVQLRSSKAPTRFRYRVDLPAGGALRETSTGDIAVSQDGRRVGTIIKPTAWDADRRAIPVTTTLRGDVLTLDVAHRGRDIRYPALLDPNYVDILQYRWYTAGNNNGTTAYWNFRTNDASKMGGIFGNYQQGNYGQGQGLYAGTRGNQLLYNGTYGYWTFTAPGTTSVAQTEWTRLSHLEIHTGGPAPCIDYGLIYNTTAWRTRGLECGNFQPAYRLSCWDCNDRDGVSHDPAVKGAQFGTSVYSDTIANTSDYVGEVTQYVVDPDDPTVSLTSQAPSGWQKTPTGTISASGSDPGLGVQSMTMTNAGTVGNSGCLDAGPCPGSMSRSASVSSLNLPDGNNTVNITARDASYYSHRDANGNVVPAQHQTTAGSTVKLDREKPTITPSGTLNDARNGFVGPSQDYVLSVTATDGSLSSPAAQRSGVTSLTATLDGQPMTDGSSSASCTRPEGSCPLTINASLTGDQIAQLDEAAPHTILIKAVDALGQEQTDSFTFRVDSTAPSLFFDGILAQLSGRVLSEDNYRLRVEATDNQPFQGERDDEGESTPVRDTPGAGLRDVVVRLDGQSASTSASSCFDDPACEQARVWDWNTTATSNGVHTVTITATDRAGNQAVEEFDVDVQRVADQPARTSTTVRRIINGAAAGDRAGAATASLGDVNGDGYTDYAVGAPGASSDGRSAAGAVYLVLGRADASTIDLANPGTSARRILGPGGGQYCGTAVAAAGDVNGDQIDDFLIGCPGLDTRVGATSTTGRVYVVFGRPDPQDLDLASLGDAGFVVTGPTDTLDLGYPLLASRPAVFGERLQSTPPELETQDVNDDGFDDIVVGDSAVKRGAQNAVGATYVIYGKADSQTVNATALGSSGYIIRGDVSDSMSGYSATISDDLDGDTIADILIGAPGQKPTTGGRAYVVSGAAYGADGDLATQDVDLGASGGRAVTLTSGQAADRFGVNVAALGDTDLDLTPDVAIGTNAGAYVLRTTPAASRQITADDGYRVTGPTNDPGLLSTQVPEAPVGAAGDLDGDERADLVVGYPDTAGARAYAIRSPEASRNINVAALPGQRGAAIVNGTRSDRSGAAVAANSYQGRTPVSENAQAIVGAPDTGGLGLPGVGAGRAYVLAELTPTGPGVEPVPADPDESGDPEAASSSATSEPSLQAQAATARRPPDSGTFNQLFNRARPGHYKVALEDPDTYWVTVRNDPQLFVIGNASDQGTFYVDSRKELGPGTTRQGNGRAFYYHGRLFGQVKRCGWVNAYKTAYVGPIPSGTRRPCRGGALRRLPPRSFARIVNCDHCDDGSTVRLRGHSSRDRAIIEDKDRIPYWRNVQPGTNEGNSSPSGSISVRTDGQRTQVAWRYLTKSKGRKFARFALVRAPSSNSDLFGRNKWAFIERRWLPRAIGRYGLCDNTNGGERFGDVTQADPDNSVAGERLDYTSQRATNYRTRLRRGDWPRVCSHRLYGVATPGA